MIDLKKFSGKHVYMQFKAGQDWYVTVAKPNDQVEILMLARPDAEGGKGQPQPCAFPFVTGFVNSEGVFELDTGNGGMVAVEFNPDVIHSVSVAIKSPGAKSSLVAVA